MTSVKQSTRVLILGGLGFIGRHLVEYLLNKNNVSYIRVVDKVLPQMAWLNKKHKDVFQDDRVEFKHANLIHAQCVQSIFQLDDGQFDYVINLAAETRYGQSDAVYHEGIYNVSMRCAEEAARRRIGRFVELSSAQIYSSDKNPIRESCRLDPWTSQAKHKLSVEKELWKIPGLNFTILRPAFVYGPADLRSLTPRLVIGAVYKHLGEKMKMLWTADLKINTVHVTDVCRAIWHVCTHANAGQVFHLADSGNTTQGKISEIISRLFDIKHGYHGSIISNFAKLNMTHVVEEINDKHLAPWSEACIRHKITNTPLTPYIDQELLSNCHLYVDGSAICEQTGFRYMKPELTDAALLEVLEDFVDMHLFPQSLLASQT